MHRHLLAEIVIRLETAVAALSLALCFLVVLFAVTSRYFFDFSYLWTDEVARYLIIWCAYFGAAAALRTGHHPRIELLQHLVSPSARRIMQMTTMLLCAACTSAVAYSGYLYVLESRSFALVSTESDLSVPLWIVHLVIPTAFTMMSARILVQAWKDRRFH